jgi:hypothetical protein
MILPTSLTGLMYYFLPQYKSTQDPELEWVIFGNVVKIS